MTTALDNLVARQWLPPGEGARPPRDRSEYGGMIDASDAEARDLLALARELEVALLEWLRTHQTSLMS